MFNDRFRGDSRLGLQFRYRYYYFFFFLLPFKYTFWCSFQITVLCGGVYVCDGTALRNSAAANGRDRYTTDKITLK